MTTDSASGCAELDVINARAFMPEVRFPARAAGADKGARLAP